MRLGRRLSTGVAEHPPAREQAERAPDPEPTPQVPAPVPAQPVTAELADR